MPSKKFKNLIDLSSKFAVVTGGLGQLGKIFTEALIDLGAQVVVVDHVDNLEKYNNQFYQFDYYNCDLTNSNSIKGLRKYLEKNYSQIDILVNNAALVGSSNLTGWNTDFENQSLDTWRIAMEVNLTSMFFLTQQLIHLLKNGINPSVINISSIYGVIAPDFKIYEGNSLNNPAAYSVSKAGVIQLTRWLASYLSPNIRVNSISPGGIFNNQDPVFVTNYSNKTPMKRMAHPEDVRGALIFLASELSQYVTGQNILVDGGWTII